MFPTLHHGDFLFIAPICLFRPGSRYGSGCRVGNIVVARHQKFGLIVKRVADVTQEGVILEGDNVEASTTAENIGLVPFSAVVGRGIKVISNR